MIIKKRKDHSATSKELPVIFHSHKKGEIKKFTKAFHSMCKHVNGFIGCAGLKYEEGTTKFGQSQFKG